MLTPIELQRHIGRVIQEGILNLRVKRMRYHNIAEVRDFLLVIADVFFDSLLPILMCVPSPLRRMMRILPRALLPHSLASF